MKGLSGAPRRVPTNEPPRGTPEWDECVKDYCCKVDTYDWVTVTDGLRGPEAFFHRNREREVRSLVRKLLAGFEIIRGLVLDAPLQRPVRGAGMSSAARARVAPA